MYSLFYISWRQIEKKKKYKSQLVFFLSKVPICPLTKSTFNYTYVYILIDNRAPPANNFKYIPQKYICNCFRIEKQIVNDQKGAEPTKNYRIICKYFSRTRWLIVWYKLWWVCFTNNWYFNIILNGGLDEERVVGYFIGWLQR